MSVEDVGAQLEALQAENDTLREAIAETTETLGTPGWSLADLRDAVGVIERLLEGKDVDMEYDGLAKQVQGLIRERDKARRKQCELANSLAGGALTPARYARGLGWGELYPKDEP